jgi:phage terminase small subunit
MLRFASEFGLTPSSRSRIVATTDPGENFSGDPMEALLREG